MRKAKNQVVYNIPGGWYGNDAPWENHPDPKHGNVIVDAQKVASAIKWLNKRAEIVSTSIIYHTGNDGIGITYRLK